VAQGGERWGHESHPPESAFQIAHHRDADHGIDRQGDFAEPAVAQEVPQCRSKSQQRTAQTIENARETVEKILTALSRSEWRTKTGMEPCARRRRENASAMKTGKNGVNR
jgi:hypothetical protein